MTKLALDPMCVLSAWEKMGGSAFSSDDAHLDDPDAFTLDLSSWEARLKPLSASSISHVDTNIFASLFNPAELGFPFLPGCCLQPATSSFFPDGVQVVPLCPSASAGSLDQYYNSDGTYDTPDCGAMGDSTQGSHMDEDGHVSIHFSDTEPAAPSASPTSSDAGIVPDFDAHSGSTQKAQDQQSNGFTATSGSPYRHQTPTHSQSNTTVEEVHGATIAAPSLSILPVLPTQLTLPVPALPSSIFVPVCQPQTGLPPPAAVTCNGPAACNEGHATQLEAAECFQQHQQPTCAPPAAAPLVQQPAAPGSGAVAAGGRHGPAMQQAQLPSSRAQLPSAATAGHSQPQQQQHHQPGSGSGMHVRTRAECLERYREKKARRLYTKKIRYQLRKINADKRPRIKGRFVKKEELAEFMAAQRGAAGAAAAAREEMEDSCFGFGAMDSDDE